MLPRSGRKNLDMVLKYGFGHFIYFFALGFPVPRFSVFALQVIAVPQPDGIEAVSPWEVWHEYRHYDRPFFFNPETYQVAEFPLFDAWLNSRIILTISWALLRYLANLPIRVRFLYHVRAKADALEAGRQRWAAAKKLEAEKAARELEEKERRKRRRKMVTPVPEAL